MSIPTAEMAKRVAETHLASVYGAAQIRSERPLRTTLHDGVWSVEGTLPTGSDGGVAIIKLCRSNGKVVSMIHEK